MGWRLVRPRGLNFGLSLYLYTIPLYASRKYSGETAVSSMRRSRKFCQRGEGGPNSFLVDEGKEDPKKAGHHQILKAGNHRPASETPL